MPIKNILWLPSITFFLISCGPVPITPSAPTDTMLPPEVTITGTKDIIPTSTLTLSPSSPPTPEKPSIDIRMPFGEWPPELQEQHPSLVNPYKANPEERAKDDDWLLKQLRLTLLSDGAGNAMNLYGYDLLRAAIQWLEKSGSHEVDLPYYIYELIMTDGAANLIPYEASTGNGYGQNSSPFPDKDNLMLVSGGNFDHFTAFNRLFTLKDKKKPFAFSIGNSITGEGIALLNLPGVEPEIAQALLMIVAETPSSKATAFAIINIVYDSGSQPFTRDTDLCEGREGRYIKIKNCAPWIGLSATRSGFIDQKNVRTGMYALTRAKMKEIMQNNSYFHIQVTGPFPGKWIDGMLLAKSIIVTKIG